MHKPYAIPAAQPEPEGLQNSVGLLISILVRFPEVCTIKYQPEEQTLRFTFMVNELLSAQRFGLFADSLKESLRTFASVTGRRMRVCLLEKNECSDVALVEIHRDVESLSREEIALISGLITQHFGGTVVKEVGEPLLEEDQAFQEELIEHMLEDFRHCGVSRDLIGFREGGRVFVFNKADAYPRRRG